MNPCTTHLLLLALGLGEMTAFGVETENPVGFQLAASTAETADAEEDNHRSIPSSANTFVASKSPAPPKISEKDRGLVAIAPPWPQTNWAYAGYMLGVALLGFGVVRIHERRLRRRNQALKTQLEIRTKDLMKAHHFLAGISHEIRNPMNGVIGIAESIRTDDLDLDRRHKLGLLRQCAGHVSALLEDILDFSRGPASPFERELKPFDLPAVMDSVAALTAADSEKFNIPVEIAISPGVPQQLTGDSRRLRQILLNFVGNALKYSGRGKVSLTVWRNQATAGRAEIFFAVCDEGPGITPEMQARLFTRFERDSCNQPGPIPDTGLGLALCKTLAEKMGGKVWVRSKAGKGSCFYLSAIFATHDNLNNSAPPSCLPIPTKQKTALVVDDEEYNRIALAGLLVALNLSVYSAANDCEALALATNHNFDLIFLDYSIPGLDGPAIARAIRALPGPSAQAAIFATTAFDLPEKRTDCLTAGMNVFLKKPVTLERLRQALGAVPHQNAVEPTTSHPIPADPLANLRLLALKKRVHFTTELALYLNELESELNQLITTLHLEDAGRTSYYAHLLYGRCSFISERKLELALRSIEAAAVGNHWDNARLIAVTVQTELAELQVRLFSDNPVAQPASGH